jgi:hypothetical protein
MNDFSSFARGVPRARALPGACAPPRHSGAREARTRNPYARCWWESRGAEPMRRGYGFRVPACGRPRNDGQGESGPRRVCGGFLSVIPGRRLPVTAVSFPSFRGARSANPESIRPVPIGSRRLLADAGVMDSGFRPAAGPGMTARGKASRVGYAEILPLSFRGARSANPESIRPVPIGPRAFSPTPGLWIPGSGLRPAPE